jgi:formylglycine-generating enzyme
MSRRLLPLAALLILAPAAAEAAPPGLRVDLGGGKELDLVLVHEGTFTQGSPPAEKGRKDDEVLHKTKIGADFYIGKYPVTRGQFARFATASGYRTEAEKGTSGGFGYDGKDLVQKKEYTWKNPGFSQTDDDPVTLVTYDDALAFTGWLTRTAGREFTLPTEAQWEMAYRGASVTPYYDGVADAKGALDLGWFKENSGGHTHPVGQKKPNAIGLHDMAGGVFEWCLDWYGPYGVDLAVNPMRATPDASDKPRRVLRGGSWFKDAEGGRAAARYRNTPGSRNPDNGFRVAGATAASALPAAPTTPPPAPVAPAGGSGSPAQPSSSGADALGWIILAGGCFGTIGALVAIVFVMVRIARRLSGGARPPNVQFRLGGDGFWVLAPPQIVGSTLRYRFFTADRRVQEGQIILERAPNGQYVYTGPAPVRVEAVAVIGAPSYAAPYARSARSWSSSERRRESRSEPFGGYPPAY